MKNDEIIKQLAKTGPGDSRDEVKEIKTKKFLIFQIKEKRYALYAEQIREIIIDVPRFYVPFVPPYIRGFINRHGEPYTIIDINVLFENEILDSSSYLILNIENDQAAILITDVCEIIKIPETEIHNITSRDEHHGYFSVSISLNNSEIFVLNLQNILDKISDDLGED